MRTTHQKRSASQRTDGAFGADRRHFGSIAVESWGWEEWRDDWLQCAVLLLQRLRVQSLQNKTLTIGNFFVIDSQPFLQKNRNTNECDSPFPSLYHSQHALMIKLQAPVYVALLITKLSPLCITSLRRNCPSFRNDSTKRILDLPVCTGRRTF